MDPTDCELEYGKWPDSPDLSWGTWASRAADAAVADFVKTKGWDCEETAKDIMLKANLPGVKKEDLKVEVGEDRVLGISWKIDVKKEDMNSAWHRVDQICASFSCRFNFLGKVNMDQVKAKMENGILTVDVPKEEVKRGVRTIAIAG